MNPLDTVLSRLPDAKRSAIGYRAACPVCAGKHGSLSLREGDNGGAMLHCFKSDCDVGDIVAALDLSLEDLFPTRLDAHHVAGPKRRNLLTAADALGLLTDEANFVFVCACNIANGVTLTDAERARCNVAASRIAYLQSESRA